MPKRSFSLILSFLFVVLCHQVIQATNIRLTDNSASSENPTIVTDENGISYVAWQDNRDGNWEIYFCKVDSNGTKLVDDTNVSNTSGSSTNPDISIDSLGNSYLTWREGSSVYFCKLNQSGKVVAGPKSVGSTEEAPAISTSPIGISSIVWKRLQMTTRTLYFCRMDSSGEKIDGDLNIWNTVYPIDIEPDVHTDTDGFSNVVYRRDAGWFDYRLTWCRIDTNGSITHHGYIYDSDDAVWPSIYANTAAFWVAFQENAQIKWLRDINDAIPIGSAGHSYYPKIVVDTSSHSFTVWQDNRNSNWDIYLQEVDDPDIVVGDNIPITEDPADSKSPDISITGEKEWHVVWQDNRDGNWEIYFDRAGLGLGTIAGTVTEVRLPPAPPIPDVLIEVLQGETLVDTTTTSEEGTYSLEINTGTYNVRASKLGYVTKTEADVVVTENETTTVDFQLPTTNITLISPEDGDVWIGGDTCFITWTTEGTGIDHIRLDYTTDGSNWISITEGTPDDGSHPWETPRIGCRTVVVRAQAEASDDHIWDWDEHMFTLGFGEFVLDRDGYSFENYHDPNPDDDWGRFKAAFDLEYETEEPPQDDREFFEEFKDNNARGNCFGMCLSSILFFTEDLDVTDQSLVGQQATSTYELDLYDGQDIISELDSLIEMYHWYQHCPRIVYPIPQPAELFYVVEEELLNYGNDDPFILTMRDFEVGFFWRHFLSEEVESAAHSVIVLAATQNGNTGEISVYDPNYPYPDGSEQKVVINLTDNTWDYARPGDSDWHGGGDRSLQLTSYSKLKNPELPGPLAQTSPDHVITYIRGPSHILFTDELGNRLGYGDGEIVEEIPGASAIPFVSQDSIVEVHTYAKCFWLPSDIDYTTKITGVDTAGHYEYGKFTNQSLFQIKEASVDTTTVDYVSYIDSISTASYTTSDSIKSYSSCLIKALPDTSGERIFSVLNTSISIGDSVNFVVSPDLASFSYINWGGPKTYDLKIEQKIGAHVDSTFYFNFSLGESTTHKFTPQNWDSLSGSQVVLEIDVGNDGSIDSTIVLDPPVAVPSAHLSGLPITFSLSPNYPNPFNPVTTIKYALPKDCYVKLTIYNILGQRVVTLVNEPQRAGYKVVRWDSRSQSGNTVASGIYFYRLKAEDFTKTRKMILLR